MSAVCRERAFAVETTERQGGWGIQFYPFRFSRYIAQTIFPQKGRAGKHQSIRNTQQLKGVKPRRGYLSRRKSRFFGNSIDFELVPIKIHLLIQGDKSGQGGWVFCDFGNSTVILWTASQCITNILFVDVAYPHSSQTWVPIAKQKIWLEKRLEKRLEIPFWFCDMSKLPIFELFICVRQDILI